ARAESNSQLDVRVRAHATPDIEIILDINPAYGDMLRAFGNGDVDIRTGVTPFDIKGNYEIDRGSYKFALMGVTSKDFILNSGSTITFNGDVMNSDLNLDAIYRTKASINTLIADSTSTARRTVDCGIGIGGKLSNPQLTFSIDIPDLDPTTAGRVASVLNTEEKRLKQVLALLISGSFVPDEQSGIVNNTTILYSNLSEIMANQVNTIFRQLDIPLDLGFNYQPGSDGMDMFDVAISTQLFNNRVTINGNIGNQRYLSSSTSEIVGNVDIDLKMTPNGNLRLNIFSHAADRFSNYLDQTQRNGIGVVYQQEFDSFREFLRNLFSRRKTTAPDAEPAPGSGGAARETTYNIRLDD
ncbi:MAG: translocation/assembly module TamB domain-containing protein, partial [Bacteroidales bacterium]|nr:translocation/assembly module TamB domain-containing protein [Bacteroidales bacterium]